ncbi:MAG: porin [Pirellulaceae bacterium]
MKLSKLALLAAFACGIQAGSASAQQMLTASFGDVAQVGCFDSEPECGYDATCCDPACGCETGCCEPACGCEVGCDSSGCDGCGCGGAGGGIFFKDGSLPNLCCSCECDLGDPWLLCGNHWGWDKGGWLQIGYHSEGRNGRNFNNHPDQVNLHQAWFFMEKAADGSNGLDWGGRVDYVYGVDAQDTQAFGLDNGHWDTSWDNGIYGHALPQAYGELAYGDLSVKLGHFYTIIGYEVVTAPDNFFYSHAFTMYNSEPFTHTGALATYNVGDNTSIFAGYTLGWDSGFADNGDNFIGGVSQQLDDTTNITFAYVAGRFSRNSNAGAIYGGEKGNMFSIVTQKQLGGKLAYINQIDYLKTEVEGGGVTVNARDTFDINNYLIYTINDCWAIGGRFEWWNVEGAGYGLAAGDNRDIYDLTLGINYRGNANWIIRPEVRWTWDEEGDAAFAVNENFDDQQTTFGIDGIFTF